MTHYKLRARERLEDYSNEQKKEMERFVDKHSNNETHIENYRERCKNNMRAVINELIYLVFNVCCEYHYKVMSCVKYGDFKKILEIKNEELTIFIEEFVKDIEMQTENELVLEVGEFIKLLNETMNK